MELKLPPFKPSVAVTINADSFKVTVTYFFLTKDRSKKEEFINSINNVGINIKFGTKNVRSVNAKPYKIIKQYNDTSMVVGLYATGIITFENRNVREEQLNLDIVIMTNNSAYSYKKNLDECRKDLFSDNVNIFELYPVTRKIDSALLIGLFAKRLNPYKDEYLPSSEDFRAELFANKGSLVWSSNHEMNYMMQIGKVLPDSSGDVNLYLMEWNYRSNAGKKLSQGDFRLKLSIPSKPYPYFVITDFKLDDKND